MNQTTNEDTSTNKLRPLAIAGFIVMIFILAWLSIQLMNVLPSAFSSLASLAEGIDEYKESVVNEQTPVALEVTSNTATVQAGATVDLAWTAADTPGTYTFSYDCSDGVTVSLLTPTSETIATCNNTYNIGDNTNLTLAVESEKERETDVTYTIAFLGNNDRTPRGEETHTFAVVNETIPDASNPDAEVATPEPTLETPTPEPPAPTTPAPSNPIPETTYTYTYEIPTSDPNGFTDLGVQITGVGRLIGNTFVSSSLSQNSSGALQFVVRNYGTKTSGSWSYDVALPDGVTYEANNQAPLKPNEAATITLQFLTDTDSTHRFTITLDTTPDTNPANDTTRLTVNLAE